MNIQISEGDLEEAANISQKIAEFDAPYLIDEYHKRLSSRNHLVLIAKKNKKIIGFKVGYDRLKDGSFYSWMGGVITDYRKQKVASKLADYQEYWAKSNGFRSIKIKTRWKFQAMISFSIKRGFSIIDMESKSNLDETRLWMEKVL